MSQAVEQEARRDAMSPEDIANLSPHPNWSDGREGYLWCRFDATIDRDRMIRAEITWGDDSEDDNNPNEDRTPSIYFEPELFIETNRPGTDKQPYPPLPEGEKPYTSFVTWDGTTIQLDRDEVIALVQGDPKDILTKYADQILKLEVWTPDKGYGDGPVDARN